MTDKRWTLKDKTQGKEKHFHEKEAAQDNKAFLVSEGHEVDIIDNFKDNSEGEKVEAEVVDMTETDGGTQTQPEPTQEPVEPAVVESSGVDPTEIESQEEFVTRVKGVPEAFMVNMGTKNNKSIHITKEGYYYLAAEAGIDVQTEPLNPSWEDDPDKSFWKATATKDGNTWSNTGSAHLEGEDMAGAEFNLDELASTRAACRVLSMATGAGVTSAIEMSSKEQ
jgi:hypothetical protein